MTVQSSAGERLFDRGLNAFFLKIQSHYIAEAGLELTMLFKLALNS
jgi:hypothetical protein